MNGTLGKPYKFFYSARNFVSGLTDIIALVKKPDGTAHGTFPLSELSGSLFLGTYIFDLPTIQADSEGEYTVIIYEQTSGHREISKVSMKLPSQEDIDVSFDADLFGRIESQQIVGNLEPATSLVVAIQSVEISHTIVDNVTISGILESNDLFATIFEQIIVGKISECNG